MLTKARAELAVRWQFWQVSFTVPMERKLISVSRMHVELFPAHCALSGAAVRELKDAFNFGLCGMFNIVQYI